VGQKHQAGARRGLRTLITLVAVALLAVAGSAWAQQGQGQGKQGGQGQGGMQAGQGQGGQGAGGAGRGQGGVPTPRATDDDSDRPDWAQGNRDLNPHAQGGGPPAEAGSKKGDIYGDLYIILRDENGVPVLTPEGWVQPIDVDGNLIPLDAEGEPVDESLLQEVEFGRLSVSRSPSKVSDHALDEALAKLQSATTITVDEAGRLVVDGSTIDSPLENLALYEAIMKDGSLPGVTLPADFDVTALLGAAADKTGEITVDLVVYENTILGINQVNPDGTITYYDLSTYDYDRASTFDGTVTYLKDVNNDGNYVEVTEPIMDAVFDGTNWTDTTAGGADDFAQAADDARAVIEFVHDVPVAP
jgi:hypothetical protein